MLMEVKEVMTKRLGCVNIQDRLYGWNGTVFHSVGVVQMFLDLVKGGLTCMARSTQPLQQGGSQGRFTHS